MYIYIVLALALHSASYCYFILKLSCVGGKVAEVVVVVVMNEGRMLCCAAAAITVPAVGEWNI